MEGGVRHRVGLQSFSDRVIDNFMYEKSREGRWELSTEGSSLSSKWTHTKHDLYG